MSGMNYSEKELCMSVEGRCVGVYGGGVGGNSRERRKKKRYEARLQIL